MLQAGPGKDCYSRGYNSWILQMHSLNKYSYFTKTVKAIRKFMLIIQLCSF